MTRLVPQTLTGQLIALLLIALVASQLLSFWVFFDERRAAVRAAARGHVLARTGAIVRLIAETPPALHERIVDTASTPRLRFWLDDEPEADDEEGSPALERNLKSELPDSIKRIKVSVHPEDSWFEAVRWHRPPPEHRPREFRRDRDRPPHHHRRTPPRRLGLTVSVQLPDARWLNAQTTLFLPPHSWAFPSIAAMTVTGVLLVVIVVVMVRRITKPLDQLTQAADRLGRGEAVEPLAASGPSDIRRTTQAFDRMRERLERFVQDRTRMLAAISHDLRTPLTALRLRAEFIADPESKERMLATIDEMNEMIEATLAFAREEAAREDTGTVDLSALIEGVCADFTDLDEDVSFAPDGRAPYACRPVALKRAVRNLVENAVRYGRRAEVELHQNGDTFRIVVSDDGPGIPEQRLEQVFEPFIRLDESRSQDGGGIGLGLSIVRSIARSHGGEVALENRAEGGLRATITLPRT